MAYPEEGVVQTWLDALKELNIRVKKMFGCYCVYCDGQPVGWLSEDIFSLREVGLSDLPPDLKRPGPGDKIREIAIPLDDCYCDWLPRAIQETAEMFFTALSYSGVPIISGVMVSPAIRPNMAAAAALLSSVP